VRARAPAPTLRARAGLGFIAVDALLMYGPPRRWIAARIDRAAHKRLKPAEKATLLRLVIARLCSLLHISFTVLPRSSPAAPAALARPRTSPPRPTLAHSLLGRSAPLRGAQPAARPQRRGGT
jgi:hypothetical protein